MTNGNNSSIIILKKGEILMPRLTEEDIIIKLWNNYEAKTYEDSKNFLNFFKKDIDK